MNLADYVLSQGKPDAVAVTAGPVSYCYADLRNAVNLMAASLLDRGVGPADRVAVFSHNSLFWVAAYLAAIKIGAVAVPLAARTPTETAAETIIWIGSKALCLGSGVEAPGDFHEGLLIREPDFLDRLHRRYKEIASFDADPRVTLASLMLTSGSTRRPRAVMVTHGNIMANTKAIIHCLGLTSEDRILCLLPFSYCFGTSLLHTHLAVGGSIVISSGIFQPAATFRMLSDHACSGFAGVPSIFQVLLRGGHSRQCIFPSCVTKIQQAGGRLAPALIQELREAAPHAKIYIMYGQTEATARLTCLPPEMGAANPGSVGLPLPGVHIQLLTPDGRIAAPGETGEVVVEGESVTRGYWDAPELNSSVFRSGQLHTGDLGFFDASGFLYLSGRTQDFIKSGGVRASVGELEESVMAVPEVVEAAAVPVPDHLRGEAVRLFVVLVSECVPNAANILQHCRRSVSNHLVPREVVFLNELPKNASGKVLKSALLSLGSPIPQGAG
jgi:acyl-CoA synthetase (AMP-forming)/AMP-acid ligase II